MFSVEKENNARLDRLEADVVAIRDEVGGLKTTVSSFGAILSRIEDGIIRSQDKDDRAKPNIIAIVSILVTIIFTMVGGAWVIGGRMSQIDQKQTSLESDVNRVEQRTDTGFSKLWDHIWETERHDAPAR